MLTRKAIAVSGIVQGVGFRPYVHRLACQGHLVGTVCNTAAGVTIEVQGPAGAVEDFLLRLPAEAPPLAHITGIAARSLPCNGDREFRIIASLGGEPARTLVPPDVALCSDCRRELLDPADRRYRYPFINCTNCGPRLTIVRRLPYDRLSTSMAAFAMCPSCRAEYEDPRNRRFHAQPNACWDCGPQVELWDEAGAPVACQDPIREAVARLQQGAIVAIKGLGGFHLACDAADRQTVCRLRERKGRVDKPFALMAADLAAAELLCEIDEAERALLESPQRPIVLLRRRPGGPVAREVAPANRYLGVFLPYTPLHSLLFADGGFPALVMTSGNRAEEPIAIDNREAVRRLRGLADCFLVHNRDILLRCDDSVMRVAGGQPRQLRRSRGFVPQPIVLQEEVPPLLAVGGELKSTVCLARGQHAFLSQHIGDLENVEGYGFFQEAVAHLERMLEVEPEAIAHDLHPDYFSTRWAQAQAGVRQIAVQHHHAHIAACMAENRLQGTVIGIALDGAGYGRDGHIWGGEVLIADYAGFTRAAHLAYVAMPGGEAAIREPWRMAVAYLARHFGEDSLRGLALVEGVPDRALKLLLPMIRQRINSPLTSSCGRLFDAVAALAGIRQSITYEGQAAIELEMAALSSRDAGAYPFDLLADGDGWILDTRSLFEALLCDLRRRADVGNIARRFHNGLAEALCEIACRVRQASGLGRVCLSGGTFQNGYLLERLSARLREERFEVFTHGEVPAGDGGLSLGQALVAAHQLGR